MRQHPIVQRLSFLVLALGIVISLPLSAHAETASVQAVPSAACSVDRRTATTHTVSVFLRSIWQETDCGLPKAGTTRAEYIQLLYHAAGEPQVTGKLVFQDVSPDADYAEALLWAQESGVARRDRENRFRPNEEISKERAQEFLSLALASLGESAQQVANSLLAAYLGKTSEEDWALTPNALAEVLDQAARVSALPVQSACVISGSPPEPTAL